MHTGIDYQPPARDTLLGSMFEDLVDAVLWIVLKLHARHETKLGQNKDETGL